jgi:hypothetical protein
MKFLRVAAFLAAGLLVVAYGVEAERADEQAAAARKPLTGPTFLVLGAQANAWNAAAVGINGTSATFDSQWAAFCDVIGNTSAAATLTVQRSVNGTNWYSSGVNTGAVTGDFGINFQSGSRYLRLISNAAATITATIACKAH